MNAGEPGRSSSDIDAGSRSSLPPPPSPPPPPPPAAPQGSPGWGGGTQSATQADWVDGGAVLIGRPYTYDQWRPVRTAWVWHIVGMVLVPWVYPFVALTVWQQRSGQTFMRRVLWAVVLTVSALCLVGLPAFVVFSRRWYWIHRTNVSPAACGVGARPPHSSKGYFEWVAVTGAALADSILHRPPAPPAASTWHHSSVPPGRTHQPLPEPWGSLVAEAAASEARLRNAYAKATGPAAASIDRAHSEAMAAQQAVTSMVYKAMEIDQARNAIDQTRLENRLTELRARPDANQDLKAAKQSIEAQLASRMRMGEAVARLEGQLHRMTAQLGEAAAQAEELSLYPPGTVIGNTDLTIAVDGLTAIREALEAVELPTTPC